MLIYTCHPEGLQSTLQAALYIHKSLKPPKLSHCWGEMNQLFDCTQPCCSTIQDVNQKTPYPSKATGEIWGRENVIAQTGSWPVATERICLWKALGSSKTTSSPTFSFMNDPKDNQSTFPISKILLEKSLPAIITVYALTSEARSIWHQFWKHPVVVALDLAELANW